LLVHERQDDRSDVASWVALDLRQLSRHRREPRASSSVNGDTTSTLENGYVNDVDVDVGAVWVHHDDDDSFDLRLREPAKTPRCYGAKQSVSLFNRFI